MFGCAVVLMCAVSCVIVGMQGSVRVYVCVDECMCTRVCWVGVCSWCCIWDARSRMRVHVCMRVLVCVALYVRAI